MKIEATPESFARAVLACLPTTGGPIGLHEPTMGEVERARVDECLASGWVSYAGPFVERFERSLEDVTGSPHVVACVSGTAALHIAMVLAGVQAGDEVMVPALTFVGTTNPITYCGATPHFVDVESSVLAIDAGKLAGHLRSIGVVRGGECFNRLTGRRIRAVVAVHVFGHPVDLDALTAVCEEFGIALVEDAAEALGSLSQGRHVGYRGIVGALSFNGNKIVTTGGGGALLCGSDELAAAARHITTTAKVSHRWEYFHDRTGYNYRLPSINAALGCGQLERLDSFLTHKRTLAERYRRALDPFSNVRFIREPSYGRSNYWLNAVALETADLCERDRFLDELHEAGIRARPIWTLQSELPMFAECPRTDLAESEQAARSVICLPSSAFLGEGEPRGIDGSPSAHTSAGAPIDA